MKGNLAKYFNLKWNRPGQELSAPSINSPSAGNSARESSATQLIPIDNLLASNNATTSSIQHGGTFRAGTMFPYAHSCTFNNPVLIDMQTPSDSSGSEALKWLQANSMTGVEHNSSARAPPPRCHVGTRSKMITEIQDILRRPDAKEKLLWISGPVGVGKSAIIQTLAEAEARDARLGATLFFPPSPTDERSQMESPTTTAHSDDPRAWITISYRLATKDPLYKAHVTKQIKSDPKLVEQSMVQQFETLIVEPIGRQGLIQAPHLLSVWIDGLDQSCRGNSKSQKTILQLILNFIQEFPSSPLAWIITSRPETHLVRIIEKHQHLQDRIKQFSIPVESDDSRKDVRHFLQFSFINIQNEYDTIEPLPWPEQNDFNVIVLAVSGFFLFAATIAQFVGDSHIADPMTQFAVTLSAINTKRPDMAVQENPLAPVHAVYTQILQSMDSRHYPVAKRILGFFLLPSGFGGDSTSFWALCNILGIRTNVAYSSLSRLHSLMEIPTPQNATTMPARLFHDSFARYLANREYSREFWIDTKEVVANLWHCHFRLLQETAKGDLSPNLPAIELAWPSNPSDNEVLKENIWDNARRVFFHHLLPCSSHHCPFGLHYDALSDVENSSELIEVLRKIHFHNLVDGYAFPDVPYRFLAFLNWVIGEGRTYLQREGFLQSLDSADPTYTGIDRNAPSFRIEDIRFYDGSHTITFKAYTNDDSDETTGTVDRSRLFSTRGTPGSFTQLLIDLGSHGENLTAEFVLGSNDDERCLISVDESLQDRIIYYVLPL